MSLNRDWCWETGGAGAPDLFCIVEITSESVQHLEDLIPRLSLPHYAYMFVPSKYCYYHQKNCSCHVFVDEHRLEDFKALYAGTIERNIWIYNIMEIHETRIEIESGYATPGDPCRASETSFLINLCDHENIAIAHWALYTGGQGYSSTTVKEGKSSVELKHYILG